MMLSLDQSQTRLSLLMRLTRPGEQDESAWCEFVDYYGPIIYRWCLYRKIQESDAEDIMQQVLLRLARNLPRFQYDPSKSFRAWVKTLTYHAYVDFLAEKSPNCIDAGVWDILSTVGAREELLKHIEDEFDLEILELAMQRVRSRVEPATWDVFRLTALENRPAAEVGVMLGKQVSTVYALRSKVQKLIQEQVQRLEASETP